MRDKVRNKVLAAISELNGATTWMERKRVVINNRKVLLSDITLQVLEELISIASIEEEGPATVLKQYRDLLVRARSEGIDTAFEDQTALEAMLAFLEAKTWDQARKVVEYYKHELFSP